MKDVVYGTSKSSMNDLQFCTEVFNDLEQDAFVFAGKCPIHLRIQTSQNINVQLCTNILRYMLTKRPLFDRILLQCTTMYKNKGVIS